VLGVGTPRGLQGRLAALIAVLVRVDHAISVVVTARIGRAAPPQSLVIAGWRRSCSRLPLEIGTCTTGC